MENLIKGKREKTTKENIKQRFWEKVEKTNYCWLWKGYKMKSGHGQFQTLEKVDFAYRYSWELHNNKKIPKGMCVLHKCDNGSCVNPEHLFIGTQADNIKDMLKKGRGKRRILTLEQYNFIKKEYKFRKNTQQMLAKKFNVHSMTIGRIIRGETYKCY